MKLQEVEDDNDDLDDSVQELMFTLISFGLLMVAIGVGILLWYLFLY